MTTTKSRTIVNGVNVDELVGHIEAMKEDPELAHFEFRARNEWVNGGHSRTEIQEFYGAGEERTRQEPFTVDGDEPPILLGGNKAPNAVEATLHALASCLATGFAYNAAARGIELESVEMELVGEVDMRGFLGISDEVRPGYQHIQVNYQVESDASQEELEELCEYVQKTSPVTDMLRNPVPVSIEMK